MAPGNVADLCGMGTVLQVHAALPTCTQLCGFLVQVCDMQAGCLRADVPQSSGNNCVAAQTPGGCAPEGGQEFDCDALVERARPHEYVLW